MALLLCLFSLPGNLGNDNQRQHNVQRTPQSETHNTQRSDVVRALGARRCAATMAVYS